MKIAILTEYYPDVERPDAGVYVHARARAYRAAAVEACVYRLDPAGGAGREVDYDGVPVFRGHAAAALARLRSTEPDVIALHTPYPGTPHTELAARLDAPTVVWVHGYEVLVTARHGYHRGIRRWLSRIEDRRKLRRLRPILARARTLVFVSEWLRTEAERNLGAPFPAARVIPNPVDVERFRPAAAGVGDPSEAGRPGDRRPARALAFRPLRRVQGLDVAVRAFADGGTAAAELAIVGSGPEAAALRALIARLGARATLAERRVSHTEVPGLLRAHDFFVMPARSATQGVAMCEAMACELPVVASRTGGIPEFVRDGADGFLVEPGDPRALAEAVGRLVADRERMREMGRCARARIVATCAMERTIAAELDVLREAAG